MAKNADGFVVQLEVVMMTGVGVDAAAVVGGGLTRWDGGVDEENVVVTLHLPRVVVHDR